VQEAAPLDGGDASRKQLCFETLTLAPFDRRLIDVDILSRGDLEWLNSYHARVLAALAGQLSPAALQWCKAACAPL